MKQCALGFTAIAAWTALPFLAAAGTAPLSFTDATTAWGYATEKNAVYWLPLAGDFDGDGDNDLFVLGHHYDGRDPLLVNLVFLNRGGGELRDATAAALGSATHSGNHGFVADYNGDGLDDVFVTADQFSLDVYLSRAGANEFAFARQDVLPGAYSCAALADFNGDRLLDAYAGHPNPHYRDGAFIGAADGTFAPDQELTARLAPLKHGAQTVWAGDYNGDGITDLYYCEWWYDEEYTVSLFRGTGAGGFVRDVPGCGIPVDGGLLSFLDLDGDGDTDALSDGKTGLRLFLNDGGGHFTLAPNGGGLATAPHDARSVAGDLDLDGDLDLVINGTVWLNGGGGQFAKRADLGPAKTACLTDLDQDGDLEIVTPARIFRNDLPPAGCITVRLRGDGGRPPVGARFELRQQAGEGPGRLVASGQLTLCSQVPAAPQWTAGVDRNSICRLTVWFPGREPVVVDGLTAGAAVEVTPNGLAPPRPGRNGPAGGRLSADGSIR